MKVLAISGSLRADSHNTRLLRAAAEHLPAGVDLEVYAGLGALPHYDADLDVEPAPAVVAELRETLRAADAVLFATPEFNGSIPGALKNALDWASRPLATNPLKGKPVAVIGGSTGLFGAVWAQADLRRVLGILKADVVAEELIVPTIHDALHPEDGLVDADQRAALAAVVAALHGAAEREPVAA
jgi:chromate reductase